MAIKSDESVDLNSPSSMLTCCLNDVETDCHAKLVQSNLIILFLHVFT